MTLQSNHGMKTLLPVSQLGHMVQLGSFVIVSWQLVQDLIDILTEVLRTTYLLCNHRSRGR